MILQAKRMDFGVNEVQRRLARPQERAYEMLRYAIMYKEKPGVDVWRGPRPDLEELHSKLKGHYYLPIRTLDTLISCLRKSKI